MAIAERIALFVAVFSLAGAFQGFIAVDLVWKLVGLAVSGGVVLWVSAQWLASWSAIKSQPGFAVGAPRRIKFSRTAAFAALSVLCMAFSAGTVLVLCFYAVNVLATIGPGDRVELWVHASLLPSGKVTLQIPPRSQSRCTPVDPARDPSNRAATVMIDWDSPNPQLQLTNFSYPQRQGISCSPRVSIDRFFISHEPPGVDIFFPERRLKYVWIIAIFWGVLWITSVFYVLFRSR